MIAVATHEHASCREACLVRRGALFLVTVGLAASEQLIFPEIVYDKIDKVRGMDIRSSTTAGTDEEAKALLAQLGVPFRES